MSILFNACNYTKHLSSNEILLGKNTLNLHSQTPIKYKGEIESEVLSYAQPQPNTHLLDLSILPKIKLWKYNNNYKVYKNDSLHEKIVKHKVERPSLIDTFSIRKSEMNMKQYLINQGYFYAEVKSKINPTNNPKIQNVEYNVEVGKNYLIKKRVNDIKDEKIKSIVNYHSDKSFIKTGVPFTNFICGQERERIYKILRNNGYFDFKMDNISFVLDTTDKQALLNLSEDIFEQSLSFEQEQKDNRDIDITMIIDQTKDSTYNQTYQFDQIYVEIIDPFYKNKDLPITKSIFEDIHFTYKNLPINLSVISKNIFIEHGKFFNLDDIEASINRLNQLGVFQQVNVNYDKSAEDPGKLNVYITLSTTAKMDFTTATDVSSSGGDYFVGFGGSVIYKNKNIFKGANQMQIKASYTAEFRNDALQDGVKRFYLSGNNASATAEFTFPKFIVPFSTKIFNKKTIPYSVFTANYTLIERKQNYSITNATGSYGYIWRETKNKYWRLNPAFLTISKVPENKLSQAFKDKINNNNYLKNIFTDNTIFGENVSFEFKSNPENLLKNTTTVNVRFEEAGTILRGIDWAYNKITNYNIYPIAQYIKFETDARRYLRYTKSEWANRAMIGIGVPLGLSSTLPYIKSYSAGGSFSNRGFNPRSLGPGRNVDTSSKLSYIDHTGDMKLELNSEYRMNLLKLLSGFINIKGAIFADAGNIWLFNKTKDVPGGEFNINYFLNDLALSTGAGLRLDFSFIVFRLDLGFPIKKPTNVGSYGFNLSNLRFRDGVWNIAFGYPF
ncbi:MAG TPA: BamA/TamA family outer membrane protein [Chitinophagaceae bacterium]|nr:BamA/TamA family outer membrane protein [Chitinophagaceae bacterium]